MSFLDSIPAFVEGVKSMVDIPMAIQGQLSDAVSKGIERALMSDALPQGIERSFKRIQKPLERSILRLSFIIVSLFFIAWGLAQFIDRVAPYRGLGFVITGVLSGVIVLLFLGEKEMG